MKGEKENGEREEHVIKTDVAQKYTEKFEEIAIDEYQDSNLVQEYILSSISKGNNMFMVGDVKQSIYRFRQAMPKLFLDKYEQFVPLGTVLFGTKMSHRGHICKKRKFQDLADGNSGGISK